MNTSGCDLGVLNHLCDSHILDVTDPSTIHWPYQRFYFETVCKRQRIRPLLMTPIISNPAPSIRQHGIHMELALLVHIDGTRARALYDRLRATYSSAQGPGAVPIPPFEEWQGVSTFCDQLLCRWVFLRASTPLYYLQDIFRLHGWAGAYHLRNATVRVYLETFIERCAFA